MELMEEEMNKQQKAYVDLLQKVNKEAISKEGKPSKKKLYYISAEFLIGKLLSNNLINLGHYEEVDRELNEQGMSVSELENYEPEPSLGNGGLGRLAACFLDSIATLNLPGDGIGLNYHYGLFLQKFKKNKQDEEKNPWIEKDSWLIPRDVSYEIPFDSFVVKSKMYDIAVTGYHGRTNYLHLFDIDTINEKIVKKGIEFDKKDIKENLTLFLYPDDSDKDGQLLRIYQQYFMVSNAAQLILSECEQRGCNWHNLYEYAVIQINDTHPTMVIPELIRLLEKKGIGRDEAIEIVSKTCAYTNHTILSEALEKWPISYLEEVVPHLVPIINYLDEWVRERYSDESVAIIDSENRVHMAHICIHFGFSVNGVAHLHTEILKNTELNHFYRIYPDKFNNKTNGITFRRWLLKANPKLTNLIESKIGDEFKQDATKLTGLLQYVDNDAVLNQILMIKESAKEDLAQFIYEKEGIRLNTKSIFDIQVKRLHEYKRQQMNALYIIYRYLQIKKGNLPKTPITVIFGAKAAPAYTIAKDIIHLILCLQKLIEKDKDVSPYLSVVMVENYNVTYAEKLIPACDVSQQISLASKEASGTGNMKFMLNGAVTLGTMDGANVEISELVGEDNIYIFGKLSDEVIHHYEVGDYRAEEYYEKDPIIREALDFIISPAMLKIGSEENLTRVYKELRNKDWFMTLLDFEDYKETRERMYADYEDRTAWAKKMLVNIAKAGFFSSDRTIEQYNEDIWHL